MYLALNSGRKVSVQQVLVRQSAIGILEGSPAFVRSHVLANAKKEAERMFGNVTGFLLIEPPDGALPRYHIFADLLSFTPIKEGFDCSVLVCSWFDSDIPEKLSDYVAAKIHGVDWAVHAKDANY